MKSPSSSVGIIESDGMRNGSNRNERISSTIRMIGKKERAYSTITGSRSGALPARVPARCSRIGRKYQTSAAQMRPVTSVATTSANEKSRIKHHLAIGREYCSFPALHQRLAKISVTPGLGSLLAADLQDGEKRLLRDLDLTELLHALLALFLLLQQLALAGYVAAVALRRDVLAQRLDRRARDDVRADRRLH